MLSSEATSFCSSTDESTSLSTMIVPPALCTKVLHQFEAECVRTRSFEASSVEKAMFVWSGSM